MKLSEFKAWFEGFTEGMDGAPSKKQWERIQSRVAEITGETVSYPVYVDRYVRPHYPSVWWGVAQGYNGSPQMNAQSANASTLNGASLQNSGLATSLNQCNAAVEFDSHAAMYSLGRADAEQLAA